MKYSSLSFHWFNERSQHIKHPHPWQSAQLEIGHLPADYPWQNLRLYTGIHVHTPAPLYVKRKTNKELVLHADWTAAEPGFHHLRLYTSASQTPALWQTSFFIEAPPLTQELWLKMLEMTYQDTYLRFQPRTPVPLQSVMSQEVKHLNHLPNAISEFSRLQWLLSPAAKLGESLSLLKNQNTQELLPLYRTRQIAPHLLYRDLKALPLHTPIRQNKSGIPNIASELQFLMFALHQRYQWLRYTLPQISRDTTTLSQALHQLTQNWLKLCSLWKNHPYHQSPPRWSSNSLNLLKSACQQAPQLKSWLLCAELLQTPLTPGAKMSPPLFTGYIGFGYVYQYWCTQQLRKALETLLLSTGWMVYRNNNDDFSAPEAHWQSPTGEQLVLLAEQRYAPLSTTPTTETLFSISRGQQPDLSLLYFKSHLHWQRQQAQKGLVFEVKFRQDPYSRPRKSDLDRLHAYRDAVFVANSKSKGHRLFVGGALLYPGQNERYEPGLEALSCLPEQELRLEYLLKYLMEH